MSATPSGRNRGASPPSAHIAVRTASPTPSVAAAIHTCVSSSGHRSRWKWRGPQVGQPSGTTASWRSSRSDAGITTAQTCLDPAQANCPLFHLHIRVGIVTKVPHGARASRCPERSSPTGAISGVRRPPRSGIYLCRCCGGDALASERSPVCSRCGGGATSGLHPPSALSPGVWWTRSREQGDTRSITQDVP